MVPPAGPACAAVRPSTDGGDEVARIISQFDENTHSTGLNTAGDRRRLATD